MRRLSQIVFGLVLVSVSMVYSGSDTQTLLRNQTFDDYTEMYLTNRNIAEAIDSLDSAEYNYYGPYSIKSPRTKARYSTFLTYIEPGVIDTTDTIDLAWQLTYGPTMADTIGAWTVLDTILYTGGYIAAVANIDSSQAMGMAFRIHNVSTAAAATAAAVIRKRIQIKWGD